MTKDNYQISKKRIAPFYILISIILMWFIGIQLFGPDERMPERSQRTSFIPVHLPGKNQMAAVKKSLYPVIMMSRRKNRW